MPTPIEEEEPAITEQEEPAITEQEEPAVATKLSRQDSMSSTVTIMLDESDFQFGV